MAASQAAVGAAGPLVTRYAFTGPARALSTAEQALIHRTLLGLAAPTAFITGGAEGVDTAVAYEAAVLYPGAELLVIAPDAPWSGWAPSGATLAQAPSGRTKAEAYMKRNDMLVAECDELVAFPERLVEALRSGTWATVRRARAAGRPVNVVPLNGSAA